MSSRPSRLRSNKILSFCCRCCSSISSLFHFSFLWVGDLQSRLSSLRYSSSSRDVACCWKSSTVGPINEDCSHTLPRVRRSWNTKGHDYSQYFNMLAERIPAILGAFEKWRKTTISFVMSVCSSVRMEQLGSHWMDFSKIWYLIIFRKSVEKIQVSLRSWRVLASSCLTVRTSFRMEKLGPPLGGFSWNLIFDYFSKICRENSSFIKIWQE